MMTSIFRLMKKEPAIPSRIATTEQSVVGCTKFMRLAPKSSSPNGKVSDGSQPPMTFDLSPKRIGWLPFAGPSGSPFL
jgi:hypothetical protein